MFKFILIALTLTLSTGIATADRRDNGPKPHDRRQPAARDHRNNQPHRVNRPAQRANRRALVRRPVYVSDNRFVFASGATRVYTRPVIRTRYYNARVRPLLIVENYPSEPGYIWVRGQWTWSGNEWRWGGGHYLPDPQYATYYDDGSYDYSVNISIGG